MLPCDHEWETVDACHDPAARCKRCGARDDYPAQLDLEQMDCAHEWETIDSCHDPAARCKHCGAMSPAAEDLFQEIFGPPPDGTLVLRGGGWTICPFEHGDGFAITPPVVPQSEPFPVEDQCPDCGARHGAYPLKHLKPGEPCGHDRERPCSLCGKPVGALSMGGSEICSWCDTGRPDLRPSQLHKVPK